MVAFGIRCADDLNRRYSECIVDSADLLNTQLAHRGLSFFFDTIDVDQRAIGGMHCEDVFGWVVPSDEVGNFVPIWLVGNDGKLEGYDCVCANREDRDGLAHAVVDGELPEETYG